MFEDRYKCRVNLTRLGITDIVAINECKGVFLLL
jgi:hypothetical protein